ncbi:aspartate/glutamate racemase family protein [Sinorhizobium mexicanum]|uniref:Aspartate/glutamate racemase family protein n=1 Tax=Sinorhizobium mexicanum TaxID=375549 RepID=A0A859QTQ4_9HYPH|nr:aspartate/glutamate racemase family protein [Sinorhizobium mexicanum]MBP1882275.1 Asp/Glu/hydantoin racemase [Sinorhizobium mexicanum]QLL61991.1 aspartate/glutamate racemase family protein [Sinorhizobium mexicanum]
MTSHILLINPNSSRASSDMMVSIARKAATGRSAVAVATAERNPLMIVTPEQLRLAAAEVTEIGSNHEPGCLGIIVSAFGDPGLAALRERVAVPVVGICEASMIEASRAGRRFGVATTTPDLLEAIGDRARDLGLWHLYTGIRCTPGDPVAVAADERLLKLSLAEAVRDCIEIDGAEAVIIGGGPLGQAAEQLQPLFGTPIIAPIPAAVERVFELMQVNA